MCAAEWPTKVVIPNVRSPERLDESCMSEPDTATPLAAIIRAMPLIPEPPIPTKCALVDFQSRLIF